MLELLTNEQKSLLLSFPRIKKLAFLILVCERMLPELRSYLHSSGRDFVLIEAARKKFWQLLSGDETSVSWDELTEKLLDLLPDSEDDGSLAAQFARNAGLVAADIAGLAEDGRNSHVVEAVGYAIESIDAKVSDEMRVFIYNRAIEEAILEHPLMRREGQREQEDIAWLRQLPEAPWPENIVSMLWDRVQTQEPLLGTLR
jgi:uncharacterized protein YjaG (DUF416 family)